MQASEIRRLVEVSQFDEAVLSQCVGALSSLRRTPTEILARIFTLYGEHIRMSGRRYILRRSSAMVLSQVCCHWRMVSRATSEVWAHVRLPTTFAVTIDSASFVRDLLTRSRNLPLSLSIFGSDWMRPVSAFRRDENTPFFDILWECHDRLSHIALDLTPRQVARLSPRIFSHDNLKSFPKLSSLSLHIGRGTHVPESEEPVDYGGVLDSFRNAPFLHSLDLYSDVHVFSFGLSTTRWSQLKYLRVQMLIDFCDARDILRQCDQLEVARICLDEFPDDGPGQQHPLCILDNLRELYFAVPYGDCPPAVFFSAVSFPNLETLAMDVSDWSIDEFRPFYTRSNFPLRRLHLERLHNMHSEDLLLFLQSLPTLETLRIINCHFRDEARLWEMFTPHPTVSLRLAQLTQLALPLNFCGAQDGSRIAEMAECLSVHRGPASPFPLLQRVQLRTHSCEPEARFEEIVEARLAAIAATGFIVREVSPDPGLDDDVFEDGAEDSNLFGN
ncbi:hypothetical protein C8R44DRAFT_869114 [Mycena epipterygia]|nr:hypothetical protein C8R44DRAFT_869114 [Mycena epipterygia]